MDILKEITKLNFTFTNTTQAIILEYYNIGFKNSTVLSHLHNLSKVKSKLEENKTENIYITIEEVNSIITTYHNLTNEYLRITGFDIIPKHLKLYQLQKDLIQYHNGSVESLKVKNHAKEISLNGLTHIPKQVKKPTKKQQFTADVEAKSAERNLKRIQKHGLK